MGCIISQARKRELSDKNKCFMLKFELISSNINLSLVTREVSIKSPLVFSKSPEDFKSKRIQAKNSQKLKTVREVNSFCERSCDLEL